MRSLWSIFCFFIDGILSMKQYLLSNPHLQNIKHQFHQDWVILPVTNSETSLSCSKHLHLHLQLKTEVKLIFATLFNQLSSFGFTTMNWLTVWCAEAPRCYQLTILLELLSDLTWPISKFLCENWDTHYKILE